MTGSISTAKTCERKPVRGRYNSQQSGWTYTASLGMGSGGIQQEWGKQSITSRAKVTCGRVWVSSPNAVSLPNMSLLTASMNLLCQKLPFLLPARFLEHCLPSKHRLFPPFPELYFLLNYHTFLSPLVASHLYSFSDSNGWEWARVFQHLGRADGKKASVRSASTESLQPVETNTCENWSAKPQVVRNPDANSWEESSTIKTESCRNLKLEWNFPPGYEGEADGDSCGRKGIFPKALWQGLRLGKEDRIFFLLSTKQENSERAARFAL